jgi:ParB family chromosome partitioning protein
VPPVDDRLVHSLPIASIQPSPRNPRQQLTGIDELAASLQAHGLVQPIVVRRAADGYQLVAGHRRLQAARALGWSEIQAVIRGESEDDAYILTLIENLQRQDLTAAEEAEALGVLIRERNWSVRRVAEAIKRDPLYVSRRLRVFEDPVLRQPVLEQRLPVSTAEVLLRVDPERRAELVAETIANGWGQMEIRRTLRAGCGVTPHPDTSGVGSQRRSEDLVRLLREATQLLDAGPVTELTAAAHSELRAFYQRLSLLERTCTSSASTRG